MQDQRIFFLGRLGASNRRDALSAAKAHGANIAKKLDSEVDLIVIGEADLQSANWTNISDEFDESTRKAFEEGRLQIVTESRFWERIEGSGDNSVQEPAYTPAMLAELVNVPVSTIRSWHRKGFISAIRTVRKLPYFGVQELLTAKVLRDLLKSGCSPIAISERMEALRRLVPDSERPLAQLVMTVEGKNLFIRKDGFLVDQHGQRRFEFPEREASESEAIPLDASETQPDDPLLQTIDTAFAPSIPTLSEMAVALEEEERYPEAIDAYRAVLMMGQPDPLVNFQLAELLYRQGDLAASRERYFMAVELDEDYVEARANLGCVLAELGDTEMAVQAFRGALALHPNYADVHYHLGIALHKLGKKSEGNTHLEIFIHLTPSSPWRDRAAELLER